MTSLSSLLRERYMRACLSLTTAKLEAYAPIKSDVVDAPAAYSALYECLLQSHIVRCYESYFAKSGESASVDSMHYEIETLKNRVLNYEWSYEETTPDLHAQQLACRKVIRAFEAVLNDYSFAKNY